MDNLLGTLKDLLAVIGGVALIASPMVLAWLKLKVHESLATAPAFITLAGRVTATENWQAEHAPDVKAIPRLSEALERLDQTLERLLRRLGE